jgi:hypothetical protein
MLSPRLLGRTCIPPHAYSCGRQGPDIAADLRHLQISSPSLVQTIWNRDRGFSAIEVGRVNSILLGRACMLIPAPRRVQTSRRTCGVCNSSISRLNEL